jgi:hypothetical protein
MERYLYFCNPDDTGAPNTTGEVAMYPTSSVTNIFAASATTTTINFVPRDGTGTTEDKVVLTHADGDHKNVMNALVSMINAEKNNSPFQVVSDKENSVFNITGVTACAITSAD